jgi:hypothetical protein
MKLGIKSTILATLLAMGMSNVANATIYQFSFSDASSGGVFAFLDFDTTTNEFRLYDNGANGYLTSPTGVNGIAFDFTSPLSLPSPVSTTQTVWDTTTIGQLSSTTVPFGFSNAYASATNGDADEINNGESTSFSFGAIDYSNIGGVALRLNTSNGSLNSSGTWVNSVGVAAVPEAETSAMMVLGLGLIGFVARRRKSA